MKTKRMDKLGASLRLGLSRSIDPGQGIAITGRGVRTVVRAWRKHGKILIATSAPDCLAIWPAERVEEEEGLLPGELRGGLVEER